MSNRAQGRKKSNFPVKTTVPSGSTFDFVYSGSNWSITDTNFYTALGVTGTIVQQGDPLGTPILNTQGTVNNIRNIETDANSGLSFTISAQGGIYAALDAQSTGTGIKVLDDTNNTIRRLKAGAGIAIAAANGDITISESAAPIVSNVVTVNDVNDFPSPIGSVIPLAADTIYNIITVVDIGAKTFSMASNTVVFGLSAQSIGITSSATGTLFSNTGGFENEISGLRITAPNCTIVGISGSFTTADMFLHGIDIKQCASVANINNCFLFRFEECGVDFCSGDGFTFSGNCQFVNVQTNFVLDFTGTLFDLGSATFDRYNMDVAQIISTSGSNKIIEGLADSGNINSGGIGDIGEVIVTGSFTDSTTIFPSDIRWNFHDNSFAADSTTDALVSMQGNATNTVITVAGTPVLIAGTWVVEGASKMTATTGGRATYNAEKDIKLNVIASVTAEPVSGGAQDMAVYIAVNGSIIANSKRVASASPGASRSITVPWTVNLSENDYVEVFVANDTTTADVLVSSSTFRVG